MKDFNKIEITEVPLEDSASLSILPVGSDSFTLSIRDDRGELRKLDSSLKEYSLQNVSDVGNSTNNDLIVKGVRYSSTLSKRITSFSSGRTFDNGELNNLIVNGYNVFTSLNGREEMNEPGLWSTRYVGMGVDIFPDFTGDTDYRPSHPAHDSLVGVGTLLGKGVKDGTNMSLFGTAVFTANDIPVWDSVTGMGKGINNAKAPHNDPNRVSIASNGFNLRSMMSNVVAYGNELWCGDIHSSTLIGYNIRNYKYIFNSLAIGGNLYDGSVKYPGESVESYLDNDILIGFGFVKDPKRHPKSHNLLIGMHEHYGNGSPDFNYKPLVEGNFKNKYFGIQGKSINYIQDEYPMIPTEEVALSLVSSPVSSNASYNTVTKKLILNNSPAGNYRMFTGLTVGESYLFTIYSDINNTGTWGYIVGDNVDSGNPDEFSLTNQLSYITSATNNYFDITLEGSGITGDIYVTLNHVKNEEFQEPSYEIRDFSGDTTFEIRTSNQNNSHIAVGHDSAGKYAAGANNSIFGTESLSLANTINDTIVFGNYNLQNTRTSRLNQILGYNNLKNTTIADRIVAIGQNIASNGQNIRSSVVIGNNALEQFKGTYINTNIWNELTIVGSFGASYVEEGRNSVLIGSSTGNSKNIFNSTIVGNRSRFKNSESSTNEIVIGAATTGNGDNTATIGNSELQSLYVGGPGAGLVLTSPDGSKKFKITVDNSGNLITTPV